MTFEEYIKKNKLRDGPDTYDWRFEVANLITEARFYAGLTQAELAKRMKTKQSSISRVENFKMLPSLDFLEKLAKAIGTELIAPRFVFMESKTATSRSGFAKRGPFSISRKKATA